MNSTEGGVSPQPAPRLLIVDDEASHMKALCETLADRGYETRGHSSPEDALNALESCDFDLILTDLMMPGIDGITLLKKAQEVQPRIVGVLMTGHGTIDTAVEAMKVGAIDYVLKPFKLSAVLPVLTRALAVRTLRLENEALARSVRERTAELETANRDLEAFAWSVSHDLLAPLRGIRGFAGLLERDFSAQLPEEARSHLCRVTTTAERMEQLVRDLLQFARSGRWPLSLVKVDVATLVAHIATELKELEPEREVDVRIAPLPGAMADQALLRQVFFNLLSNARKFTRNVAAARIDVSSRLDGSDVVYTVRDNGAGFDMKYAHRLFGVFQRLHRDAEFEGSGVGLSIVKRIVERHGGRIWVEAAVGEGAAFHFTLARGSTTGDISRPSP